MSTIAGIILAAGASRRMGSPKALLEFQGETFLDRVIGSFTQVCAETIVVLGHQADVIRRGLAHPATFVVNSDPDRGQLTSLQCGLAATAPGIDGVLFTPMDYPAVRVETVRRLVEVFSQQTGAAMVVTPRYQGRRGHPVLVSARLIPEFLTLPETAAARDVIRRHNDDIRYVDVDDVGVVTDIDTPQQYREFLDSQRVKLP
ncbi:MAG TPA: nucleotidyltransferase family protein [Bryobacteraceae bacterium]|nr:nucleotidyltransferase family protein [Bryobacteraceae bacterium]